MLAGLKYLERNYEYAQHYKISTSVVKNSVIPTWNEKLLLYVTPTNKTIDVTIVVRPGLDATTRLSFTVMDHDTFSTHDFLGQAVRFEMLQSQVTRLMTFSRRCV